MASDSYDIVAHNGVIVELVDATNTFVLDVKGKATLAGDVIRVDINSGQTGKALAVYDESATLLYSVDKAGNVAFAGTSTATGGGVSVITAQADDTLITARAGVVRLNKATAGAYTIADPVAADEGKRILVVSMTAAAHVITAATSGFNGKGSSGTATYGAAIGNTVELACIQQKWIATVKTGVTIA